MLCRAAIWCASEAWLPPPGSLLLYSQQRRALPPFLAIAEAPEPSTHPAPAAGEFGRFAGRIAVCMALLKLVCNARACWGVLGAACLPPPAARRRRCLQDEADRPAQGAVAPHPFYCEGSQGLVSFGVVPAAPRCRSPLTAAAPRLSLPLPAAAPRCRSPLTAAAPRCRSSLACTSLLFQQLVADNAMLRWTATGAVCLQVGVDGTTYGWQELLVVQPAVTQLSVVICCHKSAEAGDRAPLPQLLQALAASLPSLEHLMLWSKKFAGLEYLYHLPNLNQLDLACVSDDAVFLDAPRAQYGFPPSLRSLQLSKLQIRSQYYFLASGEIWFGACAGPVRACLGLKLTAACLTPPV